MMIILLIKKFSFIFEYCQFSFPLSTFPFAFRSINHFSFLQVWTNNRVGNKQEDSDGQKKKQSKSIKGEI